MSPTVLYPLTLGALLRFVLATRADALSTTLVVCTSRDTFLQHLSHALQHAQSATQDGDLQDITSPSLHHLLATRHVKLAFCSSVQTLLAYLTTWGPHSPVPSAEDKARMRLIVVNPLALHASTMSFSAQGLSRTFAAAIEASLKANAILHVVECLDTGMSSAHQLDGEDLDIPIEGADDGHSTTLTYEDPWDQEVAVLNVSARRFGSNSGERAWAGRTIRAKRIAARWFRFQRLDDHQTRDGQG